MASPRLPARSRRTMRLAIQPQRPQQEYRHQPRVPRLTVVDEGEQAVEAGDPDQRDPQPGTSPHDRERETEPEISERGSRVPDERPICGVRHPVLFAPAHGREKSPAHVDAKRAIDMLRQTITA